MPDLKLTLACWDYDRTRPLMDGRVKPEGIELDIRSCARGDVPAHAGQQEFDVSELSLASTRRSKAAAHARSWPCRWRCRRSSATPASTCAPAPGSRRRQDLKGKRVGTSQWSSTGLVFMRGMLQHEYGVRREDMHWFMGGLNTFVEPPLIPLDLPRTIKLDFLSEGQTLEKMFEAGELDALLSIYIPQAVP